MEPFWNAPWGEQPRFGDKPWEASPEEVQAFLNVPLHLPDDHTLPEGMALTKLTIRPEGPKTWSSARLVLSGGGRRLRLKQYHLDWWRPTDITSALQRTLGFYRAGECVVAWGRDRRGRSATAMALGRAMIEMRIERGTFVEIELRQLLTNLYPAVREALPLLREAVFPDISYHIRRGSGPRNLDELAAADWSDQLHLVRAAAPTPILLPDPLPPGWSWEAGAIWPSPPPSQSQWLLRNELGAVCLYARARPTADEQPLKLPPSYQVSQGWRTRQTLVRRRRATLAYQHPDLGGWSAAWAEGGHRYQLFVAPGALSGERGFLAMLESLNDPGKGAL